MMLACEESNIYRQVLFHEISPINCISGVSYCVNHIECSKARNHKCVQKREIRNVLKSDRRIFNLLVDGDWYDLPLHSVLLAHLKEEDIVIKSALTTY